MKQIKEKKKLKSESPLNMKLGVVEKKLLHDLISWEKNKGTASLKSLYE